MIITLVNILKPALPEMSDDTATMFMEHVRKQFFICFSTVDVMSDMYRADSFNSRPLNGEEDGMVQRNVSMVASRCLQTDQISCERMTAKQHYFTC